MDDSDIGRRELLAVLITGAAVLIAEAASSHSEPSNAEIATEPHRARYQANSPEVQTFYRVNRYPKT